MAVTSWSEAGLRTSVRKQSALWKERWQLVAVLVVAAGVYLGTSAWPVILNETDGQYAGAAREMLQRGDWLVPTNNGEPRLQKPPLVYWVTRLSLGAFGVNEFAARLPNAVATLGWIFATYLVGKRIGGGKRGVFGAAIFASMLGLFLFSHRIMPEPFLGAFVSLAIWCFLSAFRQAERAQGWFFGAWIFMALGVLSKGLHGALYPLLIAGLTALAYRKTRPRWRGVISVPGIAAFLAITVPWYAVVSMRVPGFLGYHFLNEQLGQAFNIDPPHDSGPVPFGIFWAQHFFFLFPWILFVPAAVWAWRKGQPPITGEFSLEPILWIWIIITALSISFSVRQDHYSMPAWGAVALCLALPWVSERAPPAKWLYTPCLLVALTGAMIAGAALILSQPIVASASAVAPEAARDDIHSAVQGLSMGVWRGCLLLAGATGCAWLGGGCAAAAMVRRGQRAAAAFLLAASMAVVFPIATRGYVHVQEYFSLAHAAAVINKTAEPDALVICEGEPHLSASLFFYLERRVCWAGAGAGSNMAGDSRKLGVPNSLSDDQLARLWQSPRQVCFILEQSNLAEWRKKLSVNPAQASPIARSGTRIVVVNRS